MNLDVVDLTAPLAEQVATMRGACEELGFFRIPLDSVDRATADRAWAEATDFFARPTAEKAAVGFPEPGYPYGYSPYQFETLAKSTGDAASQPDLKESLSVGPDCLGACADVAADVAASDAWIRSPSLWPATQPTLRPAWEAYFRALSGVAAELMRVMAD